MVYSSYLCWCVFGLSLPILYFYFKIQRILRMTPDVVKAAKALESGSRRELTLAERSVKLGDLSPRHCFGDEKYRALYWRTDFRQQRGGGQLVETIEVTEGGRESNFRVTFRDGKIVEWNESGLPGRWPSPAATGALQRILNRVRMGLR